MHVAEIWRYPVKTMAGGRGARLVRYEGVERFDVLPLLVATDGAIAAFGHALRRQARARLLRDPGRRDLGGDEVHVLPARACAGSGEGEVLPE